MGFLNGLFAWIPEGARLPVQVIATLIALAIGSVTAYAKVIATDNQRIDKRIRPLKIRAYEGDALLDHMFEHIEEDNSRKTGHRHNKDDLKRAAHDQLLKDEKLQKESDDNE